MVTMVRQRLPHALRSAHSVAIHSEKSDVTKGRCPGGCQEAHRPHSDPYRLDHLVRFGSAPLELASFGAGAFAIFLSRFSKAASSSSQPVVRATSLNFRDSLGVHAKRKPGQWARLSPRVGLRFSLSYARSLIGNADILSVAILRRLKGRLE